MTGRARPRLGARPRPPALNTFSVARAVTIQAARDLFGNNSAAERAVTDAWTAVGVN